MLLFLSITKTFTFAAAITSKCFGRPSSADESDPASSLKNRNFYFRVISFFLIGHQTSNLLRMNTDQDRYLLMSQD